MRRGRVLTLLLLGFGLVACSSNTPKDLVELSDSDLYTQKGVQYMETGRLDLAQQDLQRAIELDSHSSEAQNAMGVLHERLKQPDEAEQFFRRSLSLDENNPSASNNLGRILCGQGKYEQAMQLFHKAIDSRLYQTPWLALTNAGLCAKSQGKGAEAESYLRKAVEYNPRFSPALLELAKLSLENNNYLSTRAFLERFDAVNNPTAESLALGFQAEQALGNQKEAVSYLKKLRRFFPDSPEAHRFGGQSTRP